MKVLGTRILVKQRLTDPVSKGGIELPGDPEALPFGEVIQVGTSEEGTSIVIGDIILFNHLLAVPTGIKKSYVLIEYDDVLAILSPEDIENVDA